LLLNVGMESASGANLTIASHAFFVHPILAESKQLYTALERQAIGRVRRYGQSRVVHIRRFITEATIDDEIMARVSEA